MFVRKQDWRSKRTLMWPAEAPIASGLTRPSGFMGLRENNEPRRNLRLGSQ